MASNSKKTLFTVNSIISTVILSLVLISAHRYQTEAIIIPTDNEESSKSMDKNELSLSHRPGGNYFLVDDTNYPIVDSLGQTMPIKRSWNNLRGSWGKRSVDSALYAGTNSFYADGGNDEYADLMLLLNQPYFRTAEIADMSRSAERENNLNDINDMTKQRNEQKRAWTGFSNYWPIRFNSRNSANRNNGTCSLAPISLYPQILENFHNIF